MPACTKTELRLFLIAMLIGLSVLLPARAESAQHAFVIKSVETELKEGVYLVSAHIDYRFSNEALLALKNGVPLLILMDFEVVRSRSWWWDKTLAELEQGYLLLYHALSEQFIIYNLNSGTQDSYSSLDTALATLGHVHKLPLIDAKLLKKGGRYLVRLRTFLDIESLPAPMRPMAYLSSDWSLDSDWVEWPLTQ